MTAGGSAGDRGTGMLRAGAVALAGMWPAEFVADRVVLDFDRRCRRRIALTTEGGLDVLLDLPRATVLGDGDALRLDDGRFVEVVAADEDLAEVACATVEALVRVAWHLGNRHLPVQVAGDRLRIRRDHVIEDMLTRLGATVAHLAGPFDPEGGAYGEGQVHGHSHDEPHGHGHHY